MKMTDYVDELHLKSLKQVIKVPDSQIFGIFLYPETGEDLSSSYLYVYDARSISLGSASFLKWTLAGPKSGEFNVCIIARKDGTSTLPSFDGDLTNALIIETDDPFSVVYNRLCKPLSDIVYYEDKLFRLDAAARADGDRLLSLIQTAGAILRNPLWCVSMDNIVIASYIPDEAEIHPDARTVIQDIVSSSMLPESTNLRKIGFQNQDGNLVGVGSLNSFQLLVLPVYVQGVQVANIVAMAACRQFSRFDRRLLRRTSRYIYEAYFRDKSLVENAEVQYSSFLTQLLQNKISSDSTIKHFLKKAHMDNEGSCFYIMVIRPKVENIDTQDIFDVANNFKGLFTGKPYSIDGPNFVALINYPLNQRLSEAPFFTAIRNRAEATGQIIGISQMFFNVQDAPKAYANALMAAQIGISVNATDNVYNIADHTAFFFYQTMPLALIREAASVCDIRKFIDPVVTSLFDYDASHGTDYAFSLYCYLTNMFNYSVAAQKANIHKNTMVYRIRRIEEMYKINLNEHHDCFRLTLSYIIMLYMNKLDERF